MRKWNSVVRARAVLALVVLGVAVVHVSATEPTEPEQVAVDPLEREFDARLRELHERQKVQKLELRNRKDLTTEQRLEKRRALLSTQQKQVQDLEASYKSRLSPEARARWMERKANRQKRFEKIRRRIRDSAKAPAGANDPKATGTSSQ